MKVETNKKRNLQLGVVIALIGVVFICFLQRREVLDIPQKAALTFGYILLFTGALLLLVNEQFEISFDQEKSKITYFHKWFLGKKTRCFPFSAVQAVRVNRIGKPTRNGDEYFFLFLILKNGRKLNTGKWLLSHDSAVEEANKMAALIGCSVES